jgi:ribokinase
VKLHRPRITVVGSLNIDFSFRLQRLPTPGETLTAEGMEIHFGGKGANQAIAAARAGAEVSLIGCVGNDEQGQRYRNHLEAEGISSTTLHIADAPTGSAFIAVEEHGSNSIIVHPGANAHLTLEHLHQGVSALQNADALLLQLECPLPVVACAAQLAKASGVPVLVNPSPFRPEAIHALSGADIWILNESEFQLCSLELAEGKSPDGPALLKALRASALVVTRGADPTLLITETGTLSIPPPAVRPVDTVGAGDTFAGAFAVALTEGRPLLESIRFANAAGALATLQPGAQSSIPHRKLIQESLENGSTSGSPLP